MVKNAQHHIAETRQHQSDESAINAIAEDSRSDTPPLIILTHYGITLEDAARALKSASIISVDFATEVDISTGMVKPQIRCLLTESSSTKDTSQET